MRKAKNREEYVKCWKSHVTEVLYGPVRDANESNDLCARMRETVSELCRQIDEVGIELVKDGTFSE